MWQKGGMAVIDKTYQALLTMPWHGKLKGFTNDNDITHLTRYFTNQWLSDIHQNQMLDLLQHDSTLDKDTAGIEVENIAFMVFIEHGYKVQDTNKYQNSNYFAWA